MMIVQGAVHLTTPIPLHHHSRARLSRLAAIAMAPEPEPDQDDPVLVPAPCRDCGCLIMVPLEIAWHAVVCADCAADEAFRRNPW